MMELYDNFFSPIFCDIDKYEEIEMDIDSLFLILLEKEQYDGIPSERSKSGKW